MRKFCIYCGKPFEARRKDALYCSGSCRASSYADVKSNKPRPPKPNKPETLDEAMENCKRLGITYAEYQKRGMSH